MIEDSCVFVHRHSPILCWDHQIPVIPNSHTPIVTVWHQLGPTIPNTRAIIWPLQLCKTTPTALASQLNSTQTEKCVVKEKKHNCNNSSVAIHHVLFTFLIGIQIVVVFC